MIDIEKLSDEELERMASVYERIRGEYQSRSQRREKRGASPGATIEQKAGD